MDERIERMMEYCSLPDLAGKKVLDVGAGPGYWTFMLAEMGADVTAVDIDHHWVKKFQDNKPKDLDVVHMQVSVYELVSSLKKQYDVVISFALLHHVKEPLVALSNLCDMAKEMLLIECPVGKNTVFGEHKRWGKDKSEW